MAAYLVLTLVLLAGSSCSAASSRIVGGGNVNIQNHPFIVQVEHRSAFSGSWSQQCAGTVLTSSFILSAAQCFSGLFFNISNRRIRAGSATRNSGGVVAIPESAENHPTYGTNAFEGDISVVRLESPLALSASIQQGVIVAAGLVIPDNVPVTQLGWGHTTFSGQFSNTLQSVQVYTVSNNFCRTQYESISSPISISYNMLCTVYVGNSNRGSCQGDAGGPVLVDNNYVAGIISWSETCGNSTIPDVNINVASYTNWIIATAV